MTRWIFLLCLFGIGCESSEESIRRRNARMSGLNDDGTEKEPRKEQTIHAPIQVEPATREERRAAARNLLKEAGEIDNNCDRASVYDQILVDYGDLPEAKFARKNISEIKAKTASLQKRMRQLFIKLEKLNPTEENVNDRIRSTEEFMGNCKFPGLEAMAKVELEYYQKYRLKKYGY